MVLGARGAAAQTALRAAVCSILQILKFETAKFFKSESGAGKKTSKREIGGHFRFDKSAPDLKKRQNKNLF